MNFYSQNIPPELKRLKQWVCYKTRKVEQKTLKYMISSKTGQFAKSNDPMTWAGYEEAYFYMIHHKLQGLALVLSEGITFIDIDHAIDDNGVVNEIGQKVLQKSKDTYAEKSCSGHGIHILGYGAMPKDSMKRNDTIGLEMYETKRFVCITGDVLGSRNEVKEIQNEINEISRCYLGKVITYNKPIHSSLTMPDDDIIQNIRRSRQRSKFDELFSGDISSYPSWSNADYALAKLLAFWTQDYYQIDSIFRKSGLYREKWNRKIGDSTYGEITIKNAIASTKNTYQPSQIEQY